MLQDLNAVEGAVIQAEDRIPAGDDFLSREELDSLTPEILLERAKALRPLLAENARKAEMLRQPVPEVWDALRKSGIFYHFVARKWGGLEFDVEPFLDIVFELAQGCTSTAWVASFCMEHNWQFSQFPEQAQQEVYADSGYIMAPGVNSPTMSARPVDGGFILNGVWKWGTCIMHSNWVMGGGTIEGDGPPIPFYFLVPADEVTVLDTWFMDAMQATGSHDIEVKDVFVPEHRVSNFGKMAEGTAFGREVHENPMYRMPMIPFLASTAGIVIAGTARAAVHHFRDYLSTRILFGSGEKQVDKIGAQMRLGKADLMVRTAEMLIRDGALRNRQRAESAEVVPPETRISDRAQIVYAVHMCREAVNMMCEACGSTSHRLDHPMQRAQRDINMMANHVVYDMDGVTEQLGRTILGQPLTTMLA